MRVIYQDLRTRGGLDLQQATQSGDITFVRQGRSWALRYAPHLRDTWQLYTALILYGVLYCQGMAEKKLRRLAP